MTHLFSNKAESNESSADPRTIDLVVDAADTVVVLCITTKAGPRTGGAPTYDGNTMTQAGTVLDSGEGYTELWYYVADLAGGTKTFSAANTGTDEVNLIASCYESSTGETAFQATNQANASTTNPTVTVTTPAGSLVVDSLFSGFRSVIDGNDHVLLYSRDTGNEGYAAQYILSSTGASEAMGYTQDSDDWAIVAASFVEVSSGDIVPLDILTLASAVIDLSVVPGAVTIGQDVLTLASVPIDLTVLNPPPAVSVTLDVLTLASAPIDLSVVPGTAITTLDILTLASAPIDLTVVGGAISIPLDVVTLASTVVDLTVSAITSVTLDVLTLSSTPIDLSVVPGAVTVTQDVLTLASAPIDLTVSAAGGPSTVSLDTLSLASTIVDLSIVPGSVSTTLDILTLASSVIDLAVVPGTVVAALDVLTLASTVIDFSVIPGEAVTTLDALTLASSPVDLTVITVADVIILVDALTLAATLVDITVFTPPIIPPAEAPSGGGINVTFFNGASDNLRERLSRMPWVGGKPPFRPSPKIQQEESDMESIEQDDLEILGLF